MKTTLASLFQHVASRRALPRLLFFGVFYGVPYFLTRLFDLISGFFYRLIDFLAGFLGRALFVQPDSPPSGRSSSTL